MIDVSRWKFAESAGRHRPHVIVGDTRSFRWASVLETMGWGRMYVQQRFEPYSGERWAFDNGAFIWWKQGESFQTDTFLKRLEKARSMGRPGMAICPDIPAQGPESLEFSIRWREALPNDWPWYLAVQDGMTPASVMPHITRFAGVFLGGSNEFKRQAPQWAAFAHHFGKPFHYGRCGTLGKLDNAEHCKADSLDSSFPLWTEKRFQAFVLTWLYGEPQRRMAFVES
jgi:hypothetical protein